MHLLRTWRLTGLFAALAIGLVGCGEDPEPIPATIVSFEADATQIRTGTAVTLSWVTENATELALTYGDGMSVDLAGLPLASGEVEVLLDTAAEYTFTLTAQGEEGATAVTATADVTVKDPPDPVVNVFTAAPETITVGDSVTLTWETTDAASVVITEDGGDEVLNTSVEADGSIDLTPAVDTTYTLTATGEGGTTATATAAVTVLQLPVVDSFTATSGGAPVNQPVISGTEVVLAWETTHVTEVTLTDSHGNSYPVTDVDGSVTVTPSVTTTYTLGVTASGGSNTAEVTVDVLATVSAFTIASAEGTGASAVVRNGDEITLSWATEGATSLTLTGPDGFSYSTTDPAEMAAGSVTDTPATSGSYDLALEPAGAFASDAVSVEVTDAPRIRTASVDQNVITAGEAVNLSWTADGAETLLVTATSGELPPVSVDTSAVNPNGDTVAITLPAAGDWTLTIEAGNSLTTETHTKTLTVQALAIPAVVAFDVQPRRTAPGGDVVVAWETTDAASVMLKKDGVEVTGFPADQLNGTFTDTLTLTANYALEARNSLGYATTSEQIAVTAGAPEIVNFTSDLNYVAVDSPLTLSWEVEGGRSLSVTESGVELCSSTDYAEISSGTCAITTPAATGEYTYTLTVVDGAEQVTSTLTVQVSDGPIITDFYASSSIITAGSNVTLGVVVTADAAGTAPTLTLVDQNGTDYSDQVAYNSADDVWEITLTPAEGGDYTFTATAHTEGTTDSTATLDLAVAPVPEVVSFTASNVQIDTISGPFDSTLAWETTGAVALRVWELDSDGLPAGTPIVDTSDATTIASGSHLVSPASSTVYRVEAENLAGVLATAEVLIQVDLPIISTFEFQDLDGNVIDKALINQDVNLVWQTSRADTVTLSPTPWGIAEVTATRPFVDVSTMPGAVEVGSDIIANDGDYGETTVQFPAGFVFPFFGVDTTEVVVGADGVLSFDGDNLSGYNYRFDGGSSTPSGRIGLFWDDLELDGESPSGTVWTALGTDPEHGDYFAIMYRNNHFYSSSAQPSDLNFEIFLYADGNFELRYGTLTSADTGGERALGDSISIGAQAIDNSDYLDFHYNDLFPGGLANRSWYFDRQLADSDTKLMSFREDATYGITAANANGSVSQEKTIVIWSDLAASADVQFTTDAFEYQVGDAFNLSWNVEDATHAEVWLNGALLPDCTSDAPEGFRKTGGNCSFTPTTAGTHNFELRYSNPLTSSTATMTAEVRPRLSIDSFSATNGTTTTDGTEPLFLGAGESVTLSWELTGAVGLYLYDEASNADVTPATWSAVDSVTLTPTGSTRYLLYVSDTADFSSPRVDFRAIEIFVADVDVTDLSAVGIAQTWQGGSIDLTWNAVDAESVTMSPYLWGHTEGNTFTSLTADPYAAIAVAATATDDLDDATVDLDMSSKGFAFPFDGQDFSLFRVSADGYVDFGGTYLGTDSTNSGMPYSPSYGSDASGIFAAFWDDLKARDETSKILFKLSGVPGQRTLVIEWFNFERASTTYTGALTFQAVLHEQGDMEVRFLTVAPDTLLDDTVDPPVVDESATQSNVDYYTGDSATMGWENEEATYGLEIVYNDPHPELIAPGSSIKMYSTQVPSSGTRHVNLTEDTTVEVCATGGGFTDCEQLTLLAIQPGDVLVSELMIAPAPDATAEWLELRNVRQQPVDVSGWVLTDDVLPNDGVTEGSVTLPAGTVIQPGEVLTVASSSVSGFTPSVVWTDPNLVLDDASDEVALSYGALEVDYVGWDATWTIPAGKSLTLDPSWMGRDATGNDTFTYGDDAEGVWCESNPVDGDASPGWVGYGCRFPTYDFDRWGSHREFIDISSTGTVFHALGTTDTVAQLPQAMPFAFSLFGTPVTNLWVSNNGWASAEAWPDYESGNSYLPRDSTYYPDGMIAPFWDDLEAQTGSAVQYQTLGDPGSQVFVVQWTNWMHDYEDGVMTFQVQFWETGEIVFAYDRMDWLGTDDYDEDYYRGSSATIGIEDLTGLVGIEYSYNDDYSVWPGLVLEFRPRP